MNKTNKHIVGLTPFQLFGLVVMTSCLLSLLHKFSVSDVIVSLTHMFQLHALLIVVFGGICIGIVALAGGEAWHTLLKADHVEVQHRIALGLFATGVFTGYLPKKFIKMDARQFIVDMFGYPYAIVLNSSVWVVVLNASAAVLLTIVFLILNLPGELKWVFLLSILMVYGVGLHTMSNLIEYVRIRALMIFVLIHSVSIIVPLVSIAYLTEIPLERLDVILIATVAMLAWLVGYIMPGVPGGVFVREYILFMLLSPWIPTAQVLLVMVIYRIEYFIARGFLYGLGLWIQKHDIFQLNAPVDAQRFHIKH